MSASLIESVPSHLQPLSDAEKLLLDAAANGDPAVCGPNSKDSDTANDPGTGQNWPDSRAIRADLLEWLCTTDIAPKVNRQGIHVYGARISGILKFAYTVIPFPLRFQRCLFADDASFKNARVPSLIFDGSWTRTVLADGVDIANNVLFNAGFHSVGQVLFRDAKIGGSFRGDDATFEYGPGTSFDVQSGNALGCDRMKVNGGVFLHGSRFKGEVGLAGAVIGSNLECDGGCFANPYCAPDGHRYAIRADRITVSGGVFLRRSVTPGQQGEQVCLFSAKGAVRFINATMGVLDCTAATIEGDGEWGFSAEGATVSGYAVFDQFTIENGGVELRSLTTGDLTFRGAKLPSLDLRFATIRRAIRLKQMQDAANSLWVFQSASVGSLDDDEVSWPPHGRLFVDGFEYQGFRSVSFDPPGGYSQAPLDFGLRKQWVERDSSRSPQAYRQLANAYAKMGDTSGARNARYHLEELLLVNAIRESSNPYWKALHWTWRQLLRWTIGYGYKLWLSGVWLALLLTMGAIFSCAGYFAHAITPTEKDAYVFFVLHGYPPNGYPTFSVSMFAIESSLPAMNFAMADHWAAGGWLRYWFLCEKVAGWFLSIFFIAGITGLAKSDK